MDVSPETLKSLIAQLLDKKTSKEFNNIIDIGTFLWEVVDKINETKNNTNIDLQQKEDLLVKISGDVINHLEEKGIITVELALKARNLLKTADLFLDILLGLYSIVSMKKTVNNPTAENCFKTIFSFISCVSKKAAAAVDPKSVPVNENDKKVIDVDTLSLTMDKEVTKNTPVPEPESTPVPEPESTPVPEPESNLVPILEEDTDLENNNNSVPVSSPELPPLPEPEPIGILEIERILSPDSPAGTGLKN